MKNFIILLLVVLVLGGCKTNPFKPKETAPVAQTNPIVAAAGRTVAANTAVEVKEGELLSVLKADIAAARKANTRNPDGAPKMVVERTLELAEGRLPNVVADVSETMLNDERAALIEAGKLEEAQKSFDAALKQATDKAAELAVARKERDDARVAESLARSEFIKQLAANKAENDRAFAAAEAAHQKELDDIRNGVMKKQVWALNIVGAICLAIVAIGIGFGQLAGAKTVWPFGVIGMLCLGLAQIVSQWWFKWAVLAAMVAILIVVGVWVWKQFQQGKLKKALEEKSTRLQDTLHAVVPVLDKAYNNATETAREFMDKEVFAKLNERMDETEKQTVHVIRAQLASDQKPPLAA